MFIIIPMGVSVLLEMQLLLKRDNMNKLSVQNLDLKGKRVFLRADLNVPLKDGAITDDTRIKASIPTIEYIRSQGGKVILASHLGRPKGVDPLLSLSIVAKHLSSLIQHEVIMATDCIGHEVKAAIGKMEEGDVILLENLRFYKEEEDPSLDPSFAAKLADLADCYVDDAFGCAHRAHSSIVPICSYFKDKAAAGFLLDREMTFLSTILSHPKHPFYAISGGAKISSKIGVLKSLGAKVDALFIGGAMAFTFLKAQGIEVGDSLVELDWVSAAKDLLKNYTIYLPEDLVIATSLKSEPKIVSTQEGIPKGYLGFDIGPKTIQTWAKHMSGASIIFWNGPLGVFEEPQFATATFEMAKIIANTPCTTIIGGGDSIAAICQLGIQNQITHLSTGGGATLEYIEKGELPGIQALSNKY
jgi:phosphoglycerate kinase